MCGTCWEESGKPTIDTPAVRHAAECVAKLYDHPWGGVGAAMHIVTDDWNVEDGSVKFCEEHIGRYEREAKDDPTNGPGDMESFAELTALERACFDAFMPLTEDERTSALAFGRFWGKK
jgi:hypothetical protein